MKSVAPRDLCPEEWADDRRMTALFAPVRSNKELNPESWRSKINFWTDLIQRWSQENNVVCVDLSSLKTAFTRNGKSPHCLEDVLQEAVKSGCLASTASYLQTLASSHQTWGAWMLGIGAGAMKKVGASLWNSGTGTLVVVKTAQMETDRVMARLGEVENYIPCRHSVILKEAEVCQVLQENIEHPESRDFVLQALMAEKKVVKFTVENENFYKLMVVEKGGRGQQLQEEGATEVDLGLVRLKKTIGHQESRLEELEAGIWREKEVCRTNIKVSRAKAKTSLVRVKRMEERHAKLTDQLLNLEATLEGIMNAENNKLMMEAYETGLSTLKGMVDDSVLEKSEKTMSELAQLLDVNKDIQDSLVIKDDSLDDELEEELNKLLQEKDHPAGDSITETEKSANQEKSSNPEKCPEKSPEAGASLQSALAQLDRLDLNDLDDLEPVIPVKPAPAVIVKDPRTEGAKELA